VLTVRAPWGVRQRKEDPTQTQVHGGIDRQADECSQRARGTHAVAVGGFAQDGGGDIGTDDLPQALGARNQGRKDPRVMDIGHGGHLLHVDEDPQEIEGQDDEGQFAVAWNH
jgi:hypothetical protein